jgi:NAD(P)-dependent dehydrogenase (short-subunit alcohol dehydrogenase family)
MIDEKIFRLDDRPAMVVGAGSGIGRAIAMAFGAVGAPVGCVDIVYEDARETATLINSSGGQAVGLQCDISQEASVDQTCTAFMTALGAPRILVNGAAAHDASGTILDLPLEAWNAVLNVNLTGPFLMSKAVLPHMISAGGGSIIHIASQMGRVGASERPAYCATKGALIQLAKVMAADHAADNVRVDTLSPGAIETGRMTFRFGSMEEARRISGPLHLLNRLGQPNEIAAAAVFSGKRCVELHDRIRSAR